MKLNTLPAFKQGHRVVNYSNNLTAQFIYKGYEICFVQPNEKYAVIDVVVFKEPNDTEIVFRGMTVEECIDWANQINERDKNV